MDDDELYSIEEGTARVFYEYVKDSVETSRKSLDGINTRLTALIGFSGLLLRFTLDLPSLSQWNIHDNLKAFIASSLGIAILICASGLLTRQFSAIYSPDELLDAIERSTPGYSMVYVARSRKGELKTLSQLRERRSLLLKLAVLCITLASIGLVAEVLLSASH